MGILMPPRHLMPRRCIISVTGYLKLIRIPRNLDKGGYMLSKANVMKIFVSFSIGFISILDIILCGLVSGG